MEVGWSRPDDRNAHGALIWQHPGVIIKSKSLEHKWYFLIYSLLIGQLEYWVFKDLNKDFCLVILAFSLVFFSLSRLWFIIRI